MSRFWIIFLSLFCLIFVSCEGAVSDLSELSSDTELVEQSQLEESSELARTIIKTDALAGKTIRVLSTFPYADHISDLTDNSENAACAEALTKAINDRTERVESEYGIEIEEEIIVDSGRYNSSYLTRARDLSIAGTNEFDIYCAGVYDAATMAGEGLLVNLAACDGITLSNPWWSQNFMKNTSLMGTYYITGDLSISMKQGTAAIFFNKELFKKNNLAYPYDDVRNRTWTIDKMNELVKAMNLREDLNDDGRITYEDSFATGGQSSKLAYLLYGFGIRIAEIGDDGLPYLSLYSERTAKAVEKALELMQNDNYVRGDDYFSVSSTPMTLILDAFKADRCAFYMDAVQTALSLGDMQGDFGILPYPLYDTMQEEYYSEASSWGSNVYAIPNGLPDERVYGAAVILDALGYYSVDTVADTYYNVVLQYQKLRSQEDVEMLEVISKSVGSDIGAVYRVGTLQNMLESLVKYPVGSFTSSYDALKGQAEEDLNKIITTFTAQK